jgi:NAD(P)-dependent dehydrogenase (short-subunit alcohol dehydrogenase family)
MTNTPTRTAWVTGAAQGIGAAIAERLASQGVRVALLDREEGKLQQQVARMRENGAEVHAVCVDLLDASTLEYEMKSLVSAFGSADILVNNAGIALSGPAHQFSSEAWLRTFSVNVHAPFLLTQFCLPAMRSALWGRIINIASVSGMRAGTGRLAYGTSKAALIAMTQQIAVESATWGITANAVAPGGVETELSRGFHAPEDRERILGRIPARRYGTTGEIGATVAFLASEDAAYITGQVLAVDGGFTCAGFLLPATQAA